MSESEFKDIEGIEWPSEKKDSFYEVTFILFCLFQEGETISFF